MTSFEISFGPLDLPLKKTFIISRGSKEIAENVLIQLKADGITGTGEAAPNLRYNETRESALAYLKKLGDYKTDHPFDVDRMTAYLNNAGAGEYAAKAGMEMAWYDWIGRKLQIPLYKLLLAPVRKGPRTSFTIGIDTPAGIQEQILEAGKYPILKVKLGTEYDREIIRSVREITSKPVIVDANEGWKTIDEAADMIRFLEKHQISMVEQPMPVDCRREMRILRKRSAIPLFADESLTGREPLEEIAEQFHGINIKLMKTGGISTSLRLIHHARKPGLKIMVGCMVQSSVADTASALVALWADHADLDGHLLIKDNPYKGLEIGSDGAIKLPDRPGLGVVKAW